MNLNVHRKLTDCLKQLRRGICTEHGKTQLVALLKKECDTYLLRKHPVTLAMLDQLDREISELTEPEPSVVEPSNAIMLDANDRERMFRCVMRVHSDNSIHYLRDILYKCFEKISDIEAQSPIRSIAKHVDRVAVDRLTEIEENMSNDDDEQSDDNGDIDESHRSISTLMENYVLPNLFQRLTGYIARKQLTVNLNYLPNEEDN